MLALLTVCAVLCGSACARKVPSGIERGTPKTKSPEESKTQTSGEELLPVYAPERIAAASKWDGNQQMVTSKSEIYEFLDGNGKKETPYLLKSAEDVARLAANVRHYGTYLNTEITRYRGVYFRLECDIDMQGHPWWGIGGGGNGGCYREDYSRSHFGRTVCAFRFFSGQFIGSSGIYPSGRI